jgi:hypothetical protein
MLWLKKGLHLLHRPCLEPLILQPRPCPVHTAAVALFPGALLEPPGAGRALQGMHTALLHKASLLLAHFAR